LYATPSAIENARQWQHPQQKLHQVPTIRAAKKNAPKVITMKFAADKINTVELNANAEDHCVPVSQFSPLLQKSTISI